MTDELLTEDRVPLTTLAAALGVNRRTITRWVHSGYDGRRLESYRIGKKRFSSLPARRRFISAVNGQQCSGSDER